MELSAFFPGYWEKISVQDQRALEAAAVKRELLPGTVLHRGREDCTGLYLVCSGQLRAYLCSESGKEVTLYRLFSRDFCLLSASCLMTDLQADICIEAEKPTTAWVIPAVDYQAVMRRSPALAGFTTQIMAARFSDVMWKMDQILFQKMDGRVAAALLSESQIEDSRILMLTHEKLAAHVGTAREVVTRILKYLQGEGMIQLSRGTVEILDRARLEQLAEPL
jgi:CRP/FNR family transcriptional regulator